MEARRGEEALTIGLQYTVRRVNTPIHPGQSGWPDESVLGGQAEWLWGLPGVFHALSSPKTAQPVPAAPKATDDNELGQALGYWGSLNYLLVNRLGWSTPHRGLMEWYDQGKPTGDPTLALVSEVWDRDGCLDVYLAWLLMRQPRFLAERGEVPGWPDPPEALTSKWSAWLERTIERADAPPTVTFHPTGRHDPLHLTGHFGEYGQPDPHSTLSIVDATARRAVFVTDTMDAWYWDLRSKVLELPETGRSWRVDVFVRPVGFLGNFRLSRKTGLLFSGRHSIHMMGN